MSRGRSHHPVSPVSYADLAIDRFQDWPLATCRADCPPGRALALPGLQIVHFHRGDLAEVLLTPEVICRLDTALTASGRVETPHDGGWIQVHLDTDGDLFLLQSLVSLAIQANDPDRRPLRRTAGACPEAGLRVPQRRRTERAWVLHRAH
ncbi:luciferase family protein [Thermomonospora umbrina]|uniref:Luciferase domain-containing protein n=1 Tax=Thermomonospora umbrina TaxID=111806 RepID=A0A3D9SPH1_9ACTN|nr:luciferase family protein [Thermomonospora umbrina]REE97862.1 hypothetical protein DFJ69_3337 [Thermomonospora umbrina]